MAKGMNMGIFALLFVVVIVLSGIGAFGIFLMRRAARFPMLPETEAVVAHSSDVRSETEVISPALRESISQST